MCLEVLQRVLPMCRPKGAPNCTSSIFIFCSIIFLWQQIPCRPSWSCTSLIYARSLSLVLHRTIISFTFSWWTSAKQNTCPEEQENGLLSKCAFGTQWNVDVNTYSCTVHVQMFVTYLLPLFIRPWNSVLVGERNYLQITYLCSCLCVVLK